MSENALGNMIREMRRRANLTQEQLASGICSAVSISRIENGAQMPSGKVLNAILSRLGTSTYRICDVHYKSETQLEFEKAADTAAMHIKQGRYDEAERVLEGLREQAGENALNRQYFMLLEASLSVYRGRPEEAIPQLEAAFRLTKPDVEPAAVRGVLLTYREANIISILSVANFNSGSELRAIELSKALVESLEAHDSALKFYNTIKINAAGNLSQLLEKQGWYNEALKYIEKAERFCILYEEHSLLPEILYFKAKALHNTGNDAECIRILKIILPYMELINKTEPAKLARRLLNKLEGGDNAEQNAERNAKA